MTKFKYLIIGAQLTLSFSVYSEETLPTKGNFSLPSSQQPGSFLSIGQNILDKYNTQLAFFIDDYLATDSYSADLLPNYIYALTDRLSVQLNLPIALRYKQNQQHSSGFEDFNIQFEYAYHTKQIRQHSEQATVLANVTFPTGSINAQPPTGTGAPSFLLGTTYARIYENWYGFVSPGALLTTTRKGTKYGNKYLYQLGLGRNIAFSPSKWIAAWLVELDGQYSPHNKINGLRDNNSGGNVIYVTPSFWYSRTHLIMQFGIGKAIAQHLFGNQNANSYVYAANASWTFTKPKK